MKAATQLTKETPAPLPAKRLLSIERDSRIRFHELGTLTSVTRWVSSHDEGIAEWLKNTRRAYQPDRANVPEKHRAAILLFKDSSAGAPARIGLLDVGGATLENVTAWSTWQDPHASGRGSRFTGEETQGNGGKAYMYRLFAGPGRILGVRDGKLNCKGFDGPPNSLERGIPGFMPNAASARNLPNVSWKLELDRALADYGVAFAELPADLSAALRQRKAFTLVEGMDPLGFPKGRIEASDLLLRVLRHDQSSLALQQLRLYAAHNGRLLNSGKPFDLEHIPPFPGFEQPLACEIPDSLPDPSGAACSTTLGGERPRGRLVLYTSRENMPNALRKLRPRWKVSYRTASQMIGSKAVSELAPNTPGSQHIYALVELSALEPHYVELGRKRPLDGPLVQALDLFIAEAIRRLARSISESRRQELDQRALDEVHQENQFLNTFKNRYLPGGAYVNNGSGISENSVGDGCGSGPHENPATSLDQNGNAPGTTLASESALSDPQLALPAAIELAWRPAAPLRIGCGVHLSLAALLTPRLLDRAGNVLRRAGLEWHTADRHIAHFGDRQELIAASKGRTEIWARLKNTKIESPKISVEVWSVDHVLLSPRTLEIPLGRKRQILAEVTSDEGLRATDVFLNWRHDSPNPLTLRIHPNGWVTANRLGQARVTAGTGDPSQSGIWSRVPTEISVVPPPDEPAHGAGFPELRLTDRDLDPATGEIRPGDPEQPALWQEVSDYQSNLWWLNLQSPDAAFFFAQRAADIRLWRAFHAQKLVDMVIQIHMREEFDAKGETERPDLWARHKVMLDLKEVHLKQAMWQKLRVYVDAGTLD